MRFLIGLSLITALCACGSGSSSGTAKTEAGKTDTGKAAEPAKKAPPDAWETWNNSGVGTSITVEMDSAGNRVKTIKTLDKKGAEEHVLRTEMIIKVGDQEMKTPGEEKVPKAKAVALDGNCALCKKAYKDHKDEAKWTDEKVRVGDKEVSALKWEPPATQCDGSANPAQGTTMWYSADVPGGMVKMETAAMKMTVIAMDRK